MIIINESLVRFLGKKKSIDGYRERFLRTQTATPEKEIN